MFRVQMSVGIISFIFHEIALTENALFVWSFPFLNISKTTYFNALVKLNVINGEKILIHIFFYLFLKIMSFLIIIYWQWQFVQYILLLRFWQHLLLIFMRVEWAKLNNKFSEDFVVDVFIINALSLYGKLFSKNIVLYYLYYISQTFMQNIHIWTGAIRKQCSVCKNVQMRAQMCESTKSCIEFYNWGSVLERNNLTESMYNAHVLTFLISFHSNEN